MISARVSSSERGIAQLVILLLIAVALPIAIFAVGRELSLRSKASEPCPLSAPCPGQSSQPATPEQKRRADVTDDKALTIVDALFIARFAEGKDQVMGAWGDANKDGKVTEEDVKELAKTIVLYIPADAEIKRRGDVDRDGKLTAFDIDYIRRFIAQKDQVIGAFGDVDHDGKVTKADADKVLQFVAGKARPTAEDTRRADVTRNGKIEATDALFIQRFAEGKDKVLGAFGDVNQDGAITKADADLTATFVSELPPASASASAKP